MARTGSKYLGWSYVPPQLRENASEAARQKIKTNDEVIKELRAFFKNKFGYEPARVFAGQPEHHFYAGPICQALDNLDDGGIIQEQEVDNETGNP